MLVRKLFSLIILLTGFSTSIIAQPTNNYTKNWSAVEAFEKKGLTRSALGEVIIIYNLAMKDNNDAQQIKSCMYQIKYRNMLEEDSRENNIFFVDTLIEKARVPAKNVLQSMQAEMFWQYRQNNRWKFDERTKLLTEKNKDISTWSIDKFYSTVTNLYKASLSDQSLLRSVKLDAFDPIIIKGENTRQLRPTLYDFLVHRALTYFMTDESDLTRPAFQFKIRETVAFAEASDFIHAAFSTKDSASLQHTALLLLQDLLKYHLADPEPSALLDADLIRLNFVHEYGVMDDKEKLFEAALKHIEEKYPSHPAVAQAMFLRASIYLARGRKYNPFTSPDNQYEIKKARELFENIVARFPAAEGGINASNTIGQIKEPDLNLETEKINVPEQPFRSLITYKNLSKIYLRVIKTSREELNTLQGKEYKRLWQAYTAMKPLKSWDQSLPDLQDHQSHTAEIKLPALPAGVYLVIASLDSEFSVGRNIMARQLIHVSNISYIHTSKNQYFVLDRDNGKPLPNTQVQVWQSKYNYKVSAYEEIRDEKYVTDQNGYFIMKNQITYRNFLLQFINGNDELFLDESNYAGYYNSYTPELKPQTFLFTDRSIYRPGQTVYFKGIVVQKEKNVSSSKILPDFITRVVLKDANGQKVSEMNVITNSFGSYHGAFQLPEGLLNGQFSLTDTATNGFQNLSVEEYKRPKFLVEVQKPKGSYKVNDSISVTGTAKAYAGNNIDGARVKYRVVRKVKYPPWWDWGYFRGGFGRQENVEIGNGETGTDTRGEFNITFKALPDESVDKKSQPTFYYEVTADITDLNGETRSGNTSVAVSYQALKLNIAVPDKLVADSLKDLMISSTNGNDLFEQARVKVTIQKVKAPGKLFRERFWSMPDQFTMSREEYYGYFPYDIYKDEDRIQNWPIGELVSDITDTSKSSGQWTVSKEHWEPGWYKIVAVTKDKFGEEVRAEKYIQLVKGLSDKTTDAPITVDVNRNSFEPGDTIRYQIKTGFANIWLIHALSKMDNAGSLSFQPVSSAASFQDQLIVKETDRGGMALSYAIVQHNRVYTGAVSFIIPWSNKDLTINYETFRDKLLPGSGETWKVKIAGYKGEKVAAEMMTAMYDASLDQFKPHAWSNLSLWPVLYNTLSWTENDFSTVRSDKYILRQYEYHPIPAKSYDQLNEAEWGIYTFYSNIMYAIADNGVEYDSIGGMSPPPPSPKGAKMLQYKKSARGEYDIKEKDKDGVLDVVNTITADSSGQDNPAKTQSPDVQIRKNFNETAFFFPDLQTDQNGDISFSFTIPEALTKWKLMTFAHTRELASAYQEKTTLTQKPLMVQTNAPRFLREGDRMEFSTKIVNLGDSEVTGTVQLELIDALTGKPVDGWFKNMFSNQFFTVAAGQSTALKFPMEIPLNFSNPLTYRIKAFTRANSKGEVFSDGEEMALPVLSNRMLVTESLPINLRNKASKNFRFQKLLGSGSHTTISNHALTVEYTSNPAWYAVQALPYLMEFPYECAEQTFNRYYANTLAAFITRSVPKIRTVFEKWANPALGSADSAALLSNLQKNQELKSVLLQETPWVLEAQNENQQKKNIALLFDMVRMSREQDKAMNKLKEMQSANGGFFWFTGGPDDRYITQYILTGVGHLRKLNALPEDGYSNLKTVVDKAIPYLDKKIREDYDDLIRYKVNLNENNLGATAIQYLYTRSFFTEYKVADASLKAYNYYRGQAKKYWFSNSKYMQAMIALFLFRTKDEQTPKAIIRSLKENSISNEELGMYWKEWATGGYYWYQAPIESQAMMIEAFTDIDGSPNTIDDLKTWLLKQKQTQNWKTTKATAEACYSLLLPPPPPKGGTIEPWGLLEDREIEITLGTTVIRSSDNIAESGTGYFKKRIDGEKVKPEMGNITVTSKPADTQVPPSGGGGGRGGGWGSIYWQYFEDLDKITPAETPLKLNKKLFIEKNTDNGPILAAIGDEASLKVGDKVKVRIELKVDRDMEYVHMKDMRAACMEPTNVISEYKYQGGLGYYESTRDASTNFFFGWLGRGTYVFEYTMFITHTGNFSNGITSIQCMYAPEFTSHSEGIRVNVE